MVKISHRVYYYETDKMGRVYHSNFLKWMEEARTEFIRVKGISYKEIEEMGYLLPVKELNVKYINPVEYDEEVMICISIEKFTRLIIEFKYEFWDRDMKLKFGEASSISIFTNKEGKPIRVDKELYGKLREER
ncbi:acyl-CoA thioesterase [Haliovirga abyssi]|uniref:4-hydroxybenzoyl-CoA thioesterase n=1 Tax=Haliovirga abyssi TaxID=2996794 RepID=A0AAU9D3H8_9FUSO|nr:thioesterase family protein [Haliovirga abyssi]BDU50531.1 4-hydroxybenzoyl-CoA thioesterase [Haliovirga abyssi]